MKRWFNLAAIVCLVAFSSCGPDVSQADRDFVGSMIPHHLIGVRLLDDAAIRSHDVRLRRLVFEMQGYHHAEIHELEAMADEFSATLWETFPGYIGAADFANLARESGVDYDVLWLNLMIFHHDGALRLAQDAVQRSSSPRVQQMAEATLMTQTGEVAMMRRLHSHLCRTPRRPEPCNAASPVTP